MLCMGRHRLVLHVSLLVLAAPVREMSTEVACAKLVGCVGGDRSI